MTLSSITDNRYRLCYIQRSLKKKNKYHLIQKALKAERFPSLCLLLYAISETPGRKQLCQTAACIYQQHLAALSIPGTAGAAAHLREGCNPGLGRDRSMAWQLQVVCWPAVLGKSKNNSAWETRSDTIHLHLAELCLEGETSLPVKQLPLP